MLRVWKGGMVVALAVAVLLTAEMAHAGELFTIHVGGSRYDINRRSLSVSSGGYYSRSRTNLNSVRRVRPSTAAARATMPSLKTVKRGNAKGYESRHVQMLVAEKRKEQQEYRKQVRAYEKEIKKREKAIAKRKKELEKRAKLAKKERERQAKLKARAERKSAEAKGPGKSKKSGASFWDRIKRAIFGS